MKQKTINLYEFKELEKEVQEKVLIKFRENEEFCFLKEDLEYYIKDKLKELNYNIIELAVYYDLSYSQGSGAMFIGILEKDNKRYIIKHSGHYNHYNSKTIDIYNIEDGEEIEDNDFNNLYVSLCKDLEEYGYSTIEEILKDENIIETIELNEYYFTKNGKIESIY